MLSIILIFIIFQLILGIFPQNTYGSAAYEMGGGGTVLN